jgi:hypothetical protein
VRGVIPTAGSNPASSAKIAYHVIPRRTENALKAPLAGAFLFLTVPYGALTAYAFWASQALERAKSSWQIDSGKWVAFLSQSPLFPPHAHALLKEGIDAWLAEDGVKAVHVLVPQVEAALREMLIAMGESPMTPSRGGGGFETLGMGAVLNTASFRTKMDPTLRLHLRALYTEPKGINLRNKLAHGLAGEEMLGRGMANWVIHTLLAIRFFVPLEP